MPILIVGMSGTLLIGGCRCDSEPPSIAQQPVEEPAPVEEFLVFPDEMHVEDASVNEFVAQVMQTCAAGEYDAFRLLWSAREEPLPREEFEQGWQAVKGIRIRALRKFRLAPEFESGESGAQDPPDAIEESTSGEVRTEEAPAATEPGLFPAGRKQDIYAIGALVKFDPTHQARRLQEDREVIMMLIREHDQWRLARAPKAVRHWIREFMASETDISKSSRDSDFESILPP